MKKIIFMFSFSLVFNLTNIHFAFATPKFKPILNAIVGFAGGQNVPRWEYSQGLADNDSEKFHAAHRFRIGFDYIIDENLSATVLFQQGYSLWGEDIFLNDTSLGAHDGDFKVRIAYVDFTIPKTEARMRMGIFDFITPSSTTLGSPVLYSRSPGVLINTPLTEKLRASAFWTGADLDGYIGDLLPTTNGINIYGGILDFRYDKLRIAPYALQTTMSDNAGKNYGPVSLKNTLLYPGNADTTHLGISLSSSHFDPLILTFDATLSASNYNASGKSNGFGWFVLASASYRTNHGIPKIMGWYSTGDGKHDEPFQNNFTTVRGGFNATSVLFGDDWLCPAYGYRDGLHGTKALVLEWSQISFLEKVNHTVRGMYLRGTNNNANIQYIRNKGGEYPALISNIARRMNYLTTEDTVIELNFNTDYEMYKNFTIYFDLGYMNTNLADRLPTDHNFRETYRAGLQFLYTF